MQTNCILGAPINSSMRITVYAGDSNFNFKVQLFPFLELSDVIITYRYLLYVTNDATHHGPMYQHH